VASSTPSIINPRWRRWVKVRYRIIRAFIVGLALGATVAVIITSAVLR